MAKIYVGNLPFTTTDAELRSLFSQHGTVESVSLVTDRDTGQPRGFAFVQMSEADAAQAIQGLNGKDLGGRALRVNEAQDKPRSGGGPRSSGGGSHGSGRRF
jgi:cold-inducible RNA-binding protein